MKHKGNKLYNVFFPVWLLFAHPLLITAALPINFGIDLLVIFLALKSLGIKDKKPILKQVIWKSWGLGFAADLIGAAILFVLSVLIPSFLPGGTLDDIGGALFLNPFRNAGALLVMLGIIAFVGVLIHFFNREVYEKTDLTVKEQKRICLALAIATAPYLFLLPTIWFV